MTGSGVGTGRGISPKLLVRFRCDKKHHSNFVPDSYCNSRNCSKTVALSFCAGAFQEGGAKATECSVAFFAFCSRYFWMDYSMLYSSSPKIAPRECRQFWNFLMLSLYVFYCPELSNENRYCAGIVVDSSVQEIFINILHKDFNGEVFLGSSIKYLVIKPSTG